MAEEDFVELGLEGLNGFATKYHDNLPFWKAGHSHPHLHRIAHPNDAPPPDSPYAKGHSKGPRDRSSSRSGRERHRDRRDHHDQHDTDQMSRNQEKERPRSDSASFGSDGRLRRGSASARSDWVDRDTARNTAVNTGRAAIPPPPGSAAQVRAYAPDPYRGRPPSHVGGFDPEFPAGPLPEGTRRLVPPDDSIILERRRFGSRSRSRSRSRHRGPSHKSNSHSSHGTDRDRDRKGSKSGIASSVVGAFAGGLAGNNISRGDTFTTLASAVIGAVGAQQLNKKRAGRKDKKKGGRDDYYSGSSDDDRGEDDRHRRSRSQQRRGGRDGRLYFKDDEMIRRSRRSSR